MKNVSYRVPDDFQDRIEAYRNAWGLASLNKAMAHMMGAAAFPKMTVLESVASLNKSMRRMLGTTEPG